VPQAEAAMAARDLAAFGQLLDASHRSLRDDYDVSHPELDRLVELAREAGAAGARLTGAGFGGSIVALCRAERAPGVMAALGGSSARARSTVATSSAASRSDCISVAVPT